MLPPKLILAPIDFSDPSHAAMNIAADMASRFGAELLLVHVEPAIQNLPAHVSILKERQHHEGTAGDAAKRIGNLAATRAMTRSHNFVLSSVADIVLIVQSCPDLFLRANLNIHVDSLAKSVSAWG